MKLNNLGIYLSIMFIVVVSGLYLQQAGEDLQNSEFVTLSPGSLDYLTQLNINVNQYQINNVTDKTNNQMQEDGLFLAEEDEGANAITDFLATINFFKGFGQKVINPIKMVYNVPGFLLSLFGMPLSPFTILTNIINLIFYISIISLIIREIFK